MILNKATNKTKQTKQIHNTYIIHIIHIIHIIQTGRPDAAKYENIIHDELEKYTKGDQYQLVVVILDNDSQPTYNAVKRTCCKYQVASQCVLEKNLTKKPNVVRNIVGNIGLQMNVKLGM